MYSMSVIKANSSSGAQNLALFHCLAGLTTFEILTDKNQQRKYFDIWSKITSYQLCSLHDLGLGNGNNEVILINYYSYQLRINNLARKKPFLFFLGFLYPTAKRGFEYQIHNFSRWRNIAFDRSASKEAIACPAHGIWASIDDNGKENRNFPLLTLPPIGTLMYIDRSA